MKSKRKDELVIDFIDGTRLTFSEGRISVRLPGSTASSSIEVEEEVPLEVAEDIISVLEDWRAEEIVK